MAVETLVNDTASPETEDVALPSSESVSGEGADVAERLAYVLYTSGSTGRPKGVCVSHRAALFFLDAMTSRLGWNDATAMLSVTTLGFDISLLERWGPLMVGGKTQVVSAADASDGYALRARLSSSQANVLQGTPATWRLLRDAVDSKHAFSSLTALSGGEALSVELARWMAAHTRQVWNLYGPTETTVWSTAHRFEDRVDIDDSAYVDLGEALGSTRLAIVDASLRPVPTGVWGELVIGGPGVARGYEGRAAETALRFVPDPFDVFGAAAGARMYRTGDVCRMRVDGRLEFGGRRDGQIKLRGHRIEVGEIEARLMANERVGASAVIVAKEVLLAFVVPASGSSNEDIGTAKLSAALSRSLPAYMTPRRIRVLEALPLTPNGKVDRRALAAYAHDAEPSAYVAPRNPVESKLAAIFGEVLDLDPDRVSIEADFFELGGHSLLAARVATRIRDRLHRDVPLQIFFEAPTVAGLAARLDTAAESFVKPGLVAVRPEARPGAIPLSFAQERLWFLDQLNPKDAAYAIPLMLRFRGALDVDALEQALADVVRRHEVLRTTFVAEGGLPRQHIHAPNTPVAREAARIDRKESWSNRDAEPSDEAWQLALQAAQAPFDLAHGPLLRTTLIRLGKTDHLAVLSMHHIVSDGWSVHVLAREMAALYAARRTGVASSLPPLPIQYADWSLYERATANRGQWDEDSAFWAQALQGVADTLKLPTRRDIGGGARV
ncbi:MAG: condensation domain-containing protein, partial [Myxococcota bacterium]